MLLEDVLFACYDDETPETPAEGEGSPQPDKPAEKKPKVEFNPEQQEYLNTVVAAEKRRLREAAEAKITEAQQQIQEALKAKQISEEQAKAQQAKLQEMQDQWLSKEEVLKRERAKTETEMTSKLQEAIDKANSSQKKYEKTLINHAITAAVQKHKGVNSRQFERMFGRDAKVVEDKPVLVFDDYDSEGKPMQSELHPDEALKRMRDLPELYGNLFLPDGKSGVGGTVTEAGKLGPKTVDISKLTFDEYKQYRKDNPAEFGLGG